MVHVGLEAVTRDFEAEAHDVEADLCSPSVAHSQYTCRMCLAAAHESAMDRALGREPALPACVPLVFVLRGLSSAAAIEKLSALALGVGEIVNVRPTVWE